MRDFQEIWDDVNEMVKDLVHETWSDHRTEALTDAKAFLESIRDDLKAWAQGLDDGSLTAEEVEWLVKAKKSSARIAALTRLGQAKILRDKFVNGLIDVVLGRLLSPY